MTKSHISLETVERWRTVVRAIGTLCVIVGLLLGFPFIAGLLEGQGSGASHALGSDTFRTFALANSSLAMSGIIVATIGVLLLLVGHFVVR
jgi:hypothetical protein